MIKIKNYEINIENKYFLKKESEIKKSLKSSTLDAEFKKWIEENLESLLLGYKTKERNREGRTLKSLDELNEEVKVNKSLSNLFINNNLYEINNYFSKYLTKNKENMFYHQVIEINEAREFLISFEGEEYKEEKAVYIAFLNELENKREDDRLDFQNKELEKILINKVFKNEFDRGITAPVDFNKRLQKINNFDSILCKFNPPENKEKKLSTLLKDENIEKLEKVFDYSKFTKDNEYGRHKIISSLNISVCPYCNRQYVTNYGDNIKTTADLDHYYPKSKYPYLALSLYNFIPSCQICNSRMKGDKEGHLYPYDDECGDKAIFKTSNSSINGILNSNVTDFKIEFDIQKNKITQKEEDNGYLQRLKKSKEIFKIKEVYETSHNQYILDMLHTIEHYPDSYLDTIAEIFEDKSIKEEELKNNQDNPDKLEKIKKEIEVIEENKEKIKSHLKDMLKKPYIDRIERNNTLAKLTKDILNEYDSL